MSEPTDDGSRLSVGQLAAAAGMTTKALRAQRVLDLCDEHAIGGWDRAFAHEALARAHAVARDADAAAAAVLAARRAADDIADPADRDLLLADLATIPGLPAATSVTPVAKGSSARRRVGIPT